MSSPVFVDAPFDPRFDAVRLWQKMLLAQNKEKWARTVGVYHPSTLGRPCDRELYYDRLAILPQPCTKVDSFQLFELGHGLHGRVQDLFKKVMGFSEEVKFRIEPLGIGGSCDGIFLVEGWILEIKSMGTASFKMLTKPKEDHVLQVHAYMAGHGIPRAQLMYIDRDKGTPRMFPVMFSEEIWRTKVVERVERIEHHIDIGIPPARVSSDYTCRECKFHYYCQHDEGDPNGGRRRTHTQDGPGRQDGPSSLSGGDDGEGGAPASRPGAAVGILSLSIGQAAAGPEGLGVSVGSASAGGGAPVPTGHDGHPTGRVEKALRRVPPFLRVPHGPAHPDAVVRGPVEG